MPKNLDCSFLLANFLYAGSYCIRVLKTKWQHGEVHKKIEDVLQESHTGFEQCFFIKVLGTLTVIISTAIRALDLSLLNAEEE